jgi:hypothetical protein
VTTYAAEPETSTLPGPYATSPSAEGLRVTPPVLELARAEVRALLESSPAFWEMPPEQRRRLAFDLVKVAAYTAALLQEEFALTEQLDQVPMIVRQTIAPMAQAASAPPQPLAAAQAGTPAPRGPAVDEFSPRAAREAARITREQLKAVEFPTFVADLIRGTYNAIIDASIKQMEAYAELVANVAKTVDQFMSDNITDNQARDYLAGQYPAHFRVDTTGDAPVLTVRDGAAAIPAPSLKTDLGLTEDVDLNDETAESTLVPAARRKIARGRQQMLASMVMMGVNRIVVTSGRIYAKMGFHIDAHDYGSASSASKFDETNISTASGWFGFGGGATVNAVTYVSSTQKDSNDAINLNTDLTGEVELKFKTDYLPLERMATPQMIGAIQGNTPNPAANTPQQTKTA